MSKNPIYLDNNATTPILPAVVDVMLPYLREHFGNPSSDHIYGHRAREAVVLARAQVAGLIGCRPREIFFTSGGTEANNLAILGVATANPGRKHIITSVIEHPATEMPCGLLRGQGYRLSRLPVDETGMVRPVDLQSRLDDDTVLVTVMLANSETGTLQPIREMSKAAHEAGASVHTDAAQAAGKVSIDVDELGVDLLSIVGHKMYAPKGIGALFVKDGVAIEPQMLGGGHERGLRSGTENVPYIVALGKACEIAQVDLEKAGERIRQLRDHLWGMLNEGIAGLQLNGHPTMRLPNTLNVRFPGVSGNAMLARAPEIAASTGSACHADDATASAVITAMGIPEQEALGSVRLSLGRMTSKKDVEKAGRVLLRAYNSLMD